MEWWSLTLRIFLAPHVVNVLTYVVCPCRMHGQVTTEIYYATFNYAFGVVLIKSLKQFPVIFLGQHNVSMLESNITSPGHRRPAGCSSHVTPLVPVSTRPRAGQSKNSILSTDRIPVLGLPNIVIGGYQLPLPRN